MNVFRSDPYGFALPFKNNAQLRDCMSVEHEHGRFFNLSSAFNCPLLAPNFAARKVALRDLNGIQNCSSPRMVMRELLLRFSHKSWSISIDNQLAIDCSKVEARLDSEGFAILGNYINAKLICDIQREFSADPFAETRARHGIKLVFPIQLVQTAQGLLSRAPPGWEVLSSNDRIEMLRPVTIEFPAFAPAWYFLSQAFKKAGDQSQADCTYARFIEEQKREMI